MAKRKAKTWSRKFETNILKVYAKATDAEREQGLHWYATAHKDAQAIADKHGVTLVDAAGVIASISPGLEWGLNLIQAEALIGAFVRNEPLPQVGVYGRKNVNKARRILEGENPLQVLPATGPKVRAFFDCILNPETSELITVDRHAKCLAHYQLSERQKTSIVRPAEYLHLARHYRQLAKRLGLIPHQLQAITWVTWKRLVTEEVPS